MKIPIYRLLGGTVIFTSIEEFGTDIPYLKKLAQKHWNKLSPHHTKLEWKTEGHGKVIIRSDTKTMSYEISKIKVHNLKEAILEHYQKRL